MELTFLGTASNNPSPHRAVSCTALRIDGDIWLVDCGEGTQIQLMRSSLKASKITKIFITHLHGDHVFGLPGLMCTIGQNVAEDRTLDIYGPIGLRRFVRTTLELSRSVCTYKYRVHELIPSDDQYIPDEVKEWKCTENDGDSQLHPSEELGQNICVDAKTGVWTLFETDTHSVKSSWIKHRVATFGIVIEQRPQKGRLDVDSLKKWGVKPGPLYAKIKSGKSITLDDGKILNASDFIGPSKPGKKLTILGDCFEVSEAMIHLANQSDLLVHESTLENELQAKAISNGHSTPRIAAQVANRTESKRLVLNHFSQRYKPIDYEPTKKITTKIDNEKKKEEMEEKEEVVETVQKLVDEAKLDFKGEVVAAYDFFSFTV